MDKENCNHCPFNINRLLAEAEKVGEFSKHGLIEELVKRGVTMTPLAKAQFQKLEHSTAKISLFVQGEKPDTCHMKKVCCNGRDQWVMLCTPDSKGV